MLLLLGAQTRESQLFNKFVLFVCYYLVSPDHCNLYASGLSKGESENKEEGRMIIADFILGMSSYLEKGYKTSRY